MGRSLLGAPSRQELIVLGLIVRGYSNKEVAADLGVSEQTAKAHASSLMRKLGASNRAELAALAVRRHFVD